VHQHSSTPVRLCLAAMLEETTRIIGKDGYVPWSKEPTSWEFDAAFRRYQRLIEGHPLIMGRITYQNWGHCLQGIPVIVVSFMHRSALNSAYQTCSSYYEARDIAHAYAVKNGLGKIFVGGGEGLFREALREADRLYLALMKDPDVRGDAFFPNYERENFRTVRERRYGNGASALKFVTLVRGHRVSNHNQKPEVREAVSISA